MPGKTISPSRARLRWTRLLAGSLAVIASGCAQFPVATQERGASGDVEVARCERAFATVDEAVEAAGVRDAADARIAGFPYLRANRFLASYAAVALDEAGAREWIELMSARDEAARRAELANLASTASRALQSRLSAIGFADRAADDVLAGCRHRLRRHDVSSRTQRMRLRERVHVPDDYVDWQRAIGLYPLFAFPLWAAIGHLERSTRTVFETPLEQLPVAGRLVNYAPAPAPAMTAVQVAREIDAIRTPVLGIPVVAGWSDRPLPALDRIVATFAPEFEIDEAGAFDRPGRPMLGPGGEREVRSGEPVVHVAFSHARHGEDVLLQIAYTVWFSERPKNSAFDVLGGAVDGVVWRVTIGRDGRPLLFDTIHPCGCYHWFFPTSRLVGRPQPPSAEETAFAPQSLPGVEPETRVVLRIASRTHYLQRVRLAPVASAGAARYALRSDEELRSLPHPGDGRARASFFGPDGLVPGTERGERYLLWPAGIPSAGAMRQWGRHATAFVGRRHFDDPHLIGRYFTLR